ncbi:PUS1 (predicted), partial [Pycnogonum litorale]
GTRLPSKTHRCLYRTARDCMEFLSACVVFRRVFILQRYSVCFKDVKRISCRHSSTVMSLETSEYPAAKRQLVTDAVDENDAISKRPKTEISPADKDETLVPSRVKKKMYAMLLSYSGTGYYGMQRNPGNGLKTIEGDLLSSLLASGIIDRELCDHPQMMWFQRSARTDKGVSAARQIVSLKLPVDHDNLIETVNSNLPPQIRLVAIKQAKNKFNAKTHCDARTYSYITPTYAFAPLETIITEAFRITDEQCKEIQSILDMYKGSHYYHNFTSGKKAGEDSARRYIIDFKVGEPFVRDGLEFVVLTVKGQSFMLHQIRKMVALVMAIMRGFTTKDTLNQARKVDKMDVPKAPGLGLILESIHFERYNKRFEGDGIHEPLTWDEYEDVIQEMKEKYIYETII